MKSIDCNELALKEVNIKGDVLGKFSLFEIEQVYCNNSKEVLEVGYTFPIIDTATITGFKVEINDNVIIGKTMDKEKAVATYQENIVKGNSAYMMEQKTDNIFNIRLGKVAEDELVKIKIMYMDKLEIVDDTLKVFVPTLVTHKYKSTVTDKLTYGEVDYKANFKLNINKLLNLKDIVSSTHNIELKDNIVEVNNYTMNKDFCLDLKLKNEMVSNAVYIDTKDNKKLVYLSFMPEIIDIYEDEEKEYLFIVDISGSMSGKKIEETKRAVIECLKKLDIGDKFNIIPFDNEFTVFKINSVEYNEENLNEACKFVNDLKANGGTEILSPIKFALYEKNVKKIILLFTDGQVGNEDEIVKYIKENITQSKLFAFGIDNNINTSFIKNLAKSGNGKAEFIHMDEKIDEKIIRTFARIQSPILSNVKVAYGNNKIYDEIKEDTTIFNYEYYAIFVVLDNILDNIILKGNYLNKNYEWIIKKEDIKKVDLDLELIWASKQIERLEEYMLNTYNSEQSEGFKKKIIELAIKYNINSKYTSYISVYEREEKIFDVPQYQETVLNNYSNMSSQPMYDMSIRGNANMNMKCVSAMPAPIIQMGMTNFEKPEDYFDKVKSELDRCFKEFENKEDKNIIVYILFTIYYLKINSLGYDYIKFLKFLNKHKEDIVFDEKYNIFIHECYMLLPKGDENAKNELLKFVNDEYRKAMETGLKRVIDWKKTIIKHDIYEEIVNNNKIQDNLEEILKYLISFRHL